MKVYTKVVIDIESFKIVSTEWHEYLGPVAECQVSGGKTRAGTDARSAGYSLPDPSLAPAAQDILGTATPAFESFMSIMSNILQTGEAGTVGPQVPIIQRSVEASRRAGSQAQRGTTEELARTGLAGTPFGETIRAGGEREAAFQTSQIAPNMMMQFMGMLPNFLSSILQTGIGGLAGARTEAQMSEEQRRARGWQLGGGAVP